MYWYVNLYLTTLGHAHVLSRLQVHKLVTIYICRKTCFTTNLRMSFLSQISIDKIIFTILRIMFFQTDENLKHFAIYMWEASQMWIFGKKKEQLGTYLIYSSLSILNTYWTFSHILITSWKLVDYKSLCSCWHVLSRHLVQITRLWLLGTETGVNKVLRYWWK